MLLQVHQKSAPFLAFKEHPAQQLILEKSGHSYLESNVGYVFNSAFGYI
jgi:hypothetical protein